MKIQLSRYIVLGRKKFPLHVKISVKNKTRFSAVVPIPDGYPRTLLAEKLYDEKRGNFAECSISFNTNDRESMRSEHCYNKDYFPWYLDEDMEEAEVKIGFLHTYYVHINKDPSFVSAAIPEEKNAMRGLGKMMLCAVLAYALELGVVENPEFYYIFAEADGGEPVNHRVEELMEKTDDELLVYLVRNFPHAAIMYLISSARYKDDVEPIADYISRTEENGKLIEYYKKELGFTLLQSSYSPAALISAKVSTLISHCTDHF